MLAEASQRRRARSTRIVLQDPATEQEENKWTQGFSRHPG